MVKGINKIVNSTYFKLAGSTSTRGHSLKIVKERPSKKIGQHSIGMRAVNDWNAFTEETMKNTFKDRLEILWRDKPFKYDPTGYYIMKIYRPTM